MGPAARGDEPVFARLRVPEPKVDLDRLTDGDDGVPFGPAAFLVLGLDRVDPAVVAIRRPLLARVCLPCGLGFDDAALGIEAPDDRRGRFDQAAVTVFRHAQVVVQHGTPERERTRIRERVREVDLRFGDFMIAEPGEVEHAHEFVGRAHRYCERRRFELAERRGDGRIPARGTPRVTR